MSSHPDYNKSRHTLGNAKYGGMTEFTMSFEDGDIVNLRYVPEVTLTERWHVISALLTSNKEQRSVTPCLISNRSALVSRETLYNFTRSVQDVLYSTFGKQEHILRRQSE